MTTPAISKLSISSACRRFKAFAIWLMLGLAGSLFSSRADAAGTWMSIAHAPPHGLDNPILLTDGTVMCGDGGSGWYKYTPDSTGSYTNGTWTTLASTTYTRLFFSNEVLPNGNLYVAGGEYGTGKGFAELYNSLTNTWSVITNQPAGASYSDAISILLPDGRVLQGTVGSKCYFYDPSTNAITNAPSAKGSQNEAAWVRLPNDNILTIDINTTKAEHYIPSQGTWVSDNDTPTNLYGYGAELGAGFVLPNGKAFYIGASSNTAIYTPGASLSAAGSWVASSVIPNSLGAVDAPACMMNNGKILCALGVTTGFGNSTVYYEYDYTTDTFTQVGAPGGGTTLGTGEFTTAMLQLPDGGVFYIAGQGSTNVKIYYPDGAPLAQGKPTISNITPNADGSFTLTGVGLAGISAGAAYGDDWQMASNYPIIKLTDASSKVYFARTFNWSSTTIQNPNPVSTQFTLPAAFPAGTYTLQVIVNGNASTGMSFNAAGTVTAQVTGLAFTSVASNSIAVHWNGLNENQTGYKVFRSSDNVNFTLLGSGGATTNGTTTNYTDNTVTPLGKYYYRVLGVNAAGDGPVSATIFTATPASTGLPAPWLAQDIGEVGGTGAAGQTSGTYTLIASGTGLNATDDQGQIVYQSIAGDTTIIARIPSAFSTGSAGLVIRNSTGTVPVSVAMRYAGDTQKTQLTTRSVNGATATSTTSSGTFTTPLWLRLIRTGNSVAGAESTDGTNWTTLGTVVADLEPTALVGLIFSENNNSMLGSATFDNVSVQGTVAPVAPPLVHWKLDETIGTIAADTRSAFNGVYSGGYTLGQPGAIPGTANAVAFDGSSGYVKCPPLNLNSNTVTMTGWFKSNGTQIFRTGLIFCRDGNTLAGLRMGATTNDNLLGYLWGNNNFFNTSLALPVGTWTFVALVVQPTQATIYMQVAGGSMQSKTFTGITNPAQPFDGELDIGQDESGGRNFNGSIDDVQIYNRALSAAEVQNLSTGLPTADVTSPAVTEVNIPSNVGLLLQATGGNASSLRWEQSSGPGTVTFGSTTAANTTAQFSAVGTYKIYLTATSASGMISALPLVVNVGTVRYPLIGADIGTPATAGSTTYNNNGSFTITGGGANVGGTADDFQYASIPMGNATEVRARVVSSQSSGGPAKTGVMIRDTLDDDAMYAEVHLTDTSGITFSWRNATGMASASTHINNVTAPVWVRVVNSGGAFSGYYGSDGVHWTQVGTAQTFSMGSTPFAGLMECPGNDSLTTTGVLDNFGLSPTTTNVGPLVQAGSNFSAGTETATLAGTASDDGLPSASLTTSWSMVSGPGTVSFANPALLTSTVTASLNGAYDLRLTASDGQVMTFSDVIVTYNAPWNSYRASSFTSQELGNPAISGPTADPDFDGLPNLLEYAFGLQPKTPDSGGNIPVVGVSGSNLTITYRRNLTATDLSWQVMQSTDLVTWTPASVSESIVSTSGNIRTVKDSVAINGATKLFLKLSVTMP